MGQPLAIEQTRPPAQAVDPRCFGLGGQPDSAQRFKAEAAAAERKTRAEAYKAARKERLIKQEGKRHAAQTKEIEGRRARVTELHEKQLRNIAAAEAREKARHDKRIEQIKAQ